jgi:hypothetical protein
VSLPGCRAGGGGQPEPQSELSTVRGGKLQLSAPAESYSVLAAATE